MRRLSALAVVTFALSLSTLSGPGQVAGSASPSWSILSVASAMPERPVTESGRHLAFDSRASLRCTRAPRLVRTAFEPSAYAQRAEGGNMNGRNAGDGQRRSENVPAPNTPTQNAAGVRSLKSCFSDADRIGAGYTQFVSNSAVRHPHHRLHG